MSEVLLNAVIHLYAIFAASMDERQRVQAQAALERYLVEHLRLHNIADYMGLYSDFIALYEGPDSLMATRSLKLVAGRMSAQLPLRERYIVALRFFEMLAGLEQAENGNSHELINIILEEFSLDEKITGTLRRFCNGQGDNRDKLVYVPEGIFEGELAFMYIEPADMIFVRLGGGVHKVTLNGFAMLAGAISEFPAGSVMSSEGGYRLSYTEVVSNFYESNLPEVSFSGEHLEYCFKNSDNGLHDFSFTAHSGEMVGIMGGSGAGKSTLLSILNGTRAVDSGQLLLNAVDIYKNPGIVSGAIGYSPQDDLLFNDLTVYDNLYYRARLSLAHLGEEQIRERVYQVLRELGQEEIAHLRVGSPLEKIISGGQRKRLNIALELIRSPAILFVDEPTSGLSSSDSENVMALLRTLANSGRLVFVVIHQPSSKIFRSFDRLWILDRGGYPVYDGAPVEAVHYFRAESWQAGSDEGVCESCGNINPEQIFEILQRREVDSSGCYTAERQVSPKKWHEKYLQNTAEQTSARNTEHPVESNNLSTLRTPSRWEQLRIFLARNTKSHLSNRQYLLINLLEPPLLGILAALLCRGYTGHEYTFGGNGTIGVFFFISVIVALFMGLSVSAEEIIRDRKILKQEEFLNLSWFAYLNSKTVYLLLLCAVQMLIYVLITVPILEIPDMVLELWLVMFVSAAGSALLGLNLSSIMKKAVSVYILIPLVLIPQMLLSGAVISYGNLINPDIDNRYPPIFAEIMPSRWGYEALVVRQYKNNAYMRKIYGEDAKVKQLDYEIEYHLPQIRALADYKFISEKTAGYYEQVARNMHIVGNEVKRLEDKSGISAEGLRLAVPDFDKLELIKLRKYLVAVRKKFYSQRKLANEKRRKIISQLREELGNDGLRKFKEYNHNENINALALKSNTLKPLVIGRERILQDTAAVCMEPEAQRGRAHFLAPHKNVMGVKIPTFYFNLLVLTAIAAGLYLLLLLRIFPRMFANI